MALAVSSPVAAASDTTDGTSFALSAFTPTANSLLVLWVIATDTNATGSVSNTGPSMTWVNRGTQTFASGAHKLYCFTAKVPSIVSSATITFDCTGDTATGAILMPQEVTGHNAFEPIVQWASGEGNSSTPVVTRSAADTNNAYLWGIGNNTTRNCQTPSADWTATASVNYATPSLRGDAQYRVNGETSTSVGTSIILSASGTWGVGYLEIRPVGSGSRQPTYQGTIVG